MASRESDWRLEAENSILLKAVSHWREEPERWFQGSYDRLSETVRVNPKTEEKDWIEDWLSGIGAIRIPWFSGPGSAWEMPFERGAARGEVKSIMTALHETGRITRQESVSMLPVLALDPLPGQVVLDLCASPGSKTTQICEHLGDSGAVIANEVISGRVNTLVTNVQRHASRTALVVQHDGRHIPMVPGSGFDGVLVDVPCTGSGTTRKNPDVWGKWRPSSGRSLHSLQYDLLSRAIAVTKPGGRVVYSTCSLDPIENEAVVARVVAGGKVRVIPCGEALSEVPCVPGMTKWPLLNDRGDLDEESISEEYLLPTKEESVSSQLNDCLRVWNDEIGGGGFFLAVLERIQEEDGSMIFDPVPSQKIFDDPESFPQPIDEKREKELKEVWGSVPSSMWSRGKSLLWSSDEIRKIWDNERTRKSGRELIPGGRWRPLKVIHLGLIAARLRKGSLDRTVSRAARRLRKEISGPFVNVDEHVIDDILRGKEPLRSDISSLQDTDRGSRILVGSSGYCLAVWVGSRVTPMVSQSEKIVMRSVRNLSFEPKEEE
jgi:16S rRNA C967 or C1407 C5-methylase (RsmB/RsmF family)|tara:strand:+ start:573 stop:2213 length:1641 start_codon:yes stop_codon:yes gene_type:complete